MLPSCKQPEEVVIHKDKEDFTLEDQKIISQHLSRLIESHAPNYKELNETECPEFFEYINTLLGTLVNTDMVETRNLFDWEVIILQDDDIRSAFTIPGGKIYIYTGLLKMINGEHELFSILAHEIYYAEEAVVLQAMKNEYGTLVLGDLELGTDSQGAIDIAMTIQDLSYLPETVLAADQFVLDMICPFQYEARGLKSFIERAVTMQDGIKWLETRPGSPERLETIERLAENCGLEELTFSERYEYQKGLLP